MIPRNAKAWGPWPQGEDNVHDDDDPVFAPGSRRSPRLLSAQNVFLNSRGEVRMRPGTASLAALVGPTRIYPVGGYLFVHEGTRIAVVDLETGDLTTVVSGISTSNRVVMKKAFGQIWWANGEEQGIINTDLSTQNWGMPVATEPTLSAAAGSIRAGSYDVAVTWIDAAGIASGCLDVGHIQLVSTAGIRVDLTPPTLAVAADIYLTDINHGALWLAAENVAVGSMPYVLATEPPSNTAISTMSLKPPVGPDGFAPHNGMMLTWYDNVLFPSVGVRRHLFDYARMEQAFPDNITGAVSLDDFFWVFTDAGSYTVSGESPLDWKVSEAKDTRPYAAGTLRIASSLIPELGEKYSGDPVALALSEDGLMYAGPDGKIQPLTYEQQYLDVSGKFARIQYLKDAGEGHLLYFLED